MRYFLLFLVFVSSCGYPDIDSVPDFDNVVIKEEESIELCNLTNTDKKGLSECLKKINKLDNE